jgi:hypothetical protein
LSARSPRSRGLSQAELATRRAVSARDAGLQRISAITRGAIAGAVTLSGALAVIAANGFHGHTLSNTAAQTQTTQTQTTQTQTTATSSTSSALQPPSQPPSQPPVRAPVAAVVVSGGS